ncbi:hypothetical protein OGATHE_002731 [Ogataea polymorpha]|uniref:Uncharacterized protein n=1 Tax=Ogataea polymorpha TaxID=460523 RepID=A0A9P8T8U8_9ASCO|nr:hypothetical protein OGATHE_002731 [Ogataea polymorpha]
MLTRFASLRNTESNGSSTIGNFFLYELVDVDSSPSKFDIVKGLLQTFQRKGLLGNLLSFRILFFRKLHRATRTGDHVSIDFGYARIGIGDINDRSAIGALELHELLLEPVQGVVFSHCPVEFYLCLDFSRHKVQCVGEWAWDTVTTSNQNSLVVLMVWVSQTVGAFNKDFDIENIMAVIFNFMTHELGNAAFNFAYNSGNSDSSIKTPDCSTSVIVLAVILGSSMQPGSPQEHGYQNDVADKEKLIPISSHSVGSKTHSHPTAHGCCNAMLEVNCMDSGVPFSKSKRLDSHGNRVHKHFQAQYSTKPFVESDKPGIRPPGDPLHDVISSGESKEQRDQVRKQNSRPIADVSCVCGRLCLENQIAFIVGEAKNSICQKGIDEEYGKNN